MASYKVPQDVEADDKLIGPFSFRQFVYLIIVAMAGALAWALSQVFIPLAIIPLPVIIFFGALALPLRKDQPMEIYLAALVSYYLKPRHRLWDPEGIESFIEITAPKTVEVSRTKNLSQNEAEQRLSYLANIVDTGGWAIRGTTNTGVGTSMNNDVFLEAQSATDVLDTSTSVAQTFNQMMDRSTERMHQEARERMLNATKTPDPSVATAPAAAASVTDPQVTMPHYNPYPTFHQSVIQPLNDNAHQAQSDITAPVTQPSITLQPGSVTPTVPAKTDETAATTSDTELTTGIMNLANNPDLSIATIAHEASRLHKKAEDESEEVVISLR